jgi:hypothetical protein
MGRHADTRHRHRRWLEVHVALYLLGLVGLFFANRSWSPGFFWWHWVALAWGIFVCAHGVRFTRGTLASMGGVAIAARRELEDLAGSPSERAPRPDRTGADHRPA